jgi:uncharacterized membrane protein YhhN
MKNKLVSLSYIGFSIIYLLILLSGREDIAWYLKPFLLPFLMYSVYTSENFPTKNVLLFALTFSWVGDIILMFTDRGELYFIFGLVAFLISHLLYIVVFNKQLKTEVSKNKSVLLLGIGVILVYLSVMLSLLLPSLGDLKIPVILYATVISAMLLFAFKGSLHWQNPANIYILLGAIVFVASDSILAINKFYTSLPLASFWIMITYLTAQFCITSGILSLNKKKEHSL